MADRTPFSGDEVRIKVPSDVSLEAMKNQGSFGDWFYGFCLDAGLEISNQSKIKATFFR